MSTLTLDDLARVAYSHFGLPQGDPRLFPAILDILRELGHATSIEPFMPFLPAEQRKSLKPLLPLE